MCDDCRRLATEHLVDYALMGLALEVAMRVERDAVVQRCLKDKAGQEAIEDALALSTVVEEQAGKLIAVRDYMPSSYEQILTERQIQNMVTPAN